MLSCWFLCTIFQRLNMSFRKPCHMPFRKLIPPFTLTEQPAACALIGAKKGVIFTLILASDFIILSRAQRADHARIASELRFGHKSFYRFGIRSCLTTSHKQDNLKDAFNMTSSRTLGFQATRPVNKFSDLGSFYSNLVPRCPTAKGTTV